MKVIQLPATEPFLCVGHAWGAVPFSAVLTENFSGNVVVTVFYTGTPILCGVKEDDGTWDWSGLAFEGGRDNSQEQVVVDFLFHIGECSEEAQQVYVKSEMEYEDFYLVLEQTDGHPTIEFERAIENVVVSQALDNDGRMRQ